MEGKRPGHNLAAACDGGILLSLSSCPTRVAEARGGYLPQKLFQLSLISNELLDQSKRLKPFVRAPSAVTKRERHRKPALMIHGQLRRPRCHTRRKAKG